MMLYHPGDAILDILMDIITQNLGHAEGQSVHFWGTSAVQHCSFLDYVHPNLIEVSFCSCITGHRVFTECPISLPVTSRVLSSVLRCFAALWVDEFGSVGSESPRYCQREAP